MMKAICTSYRFNVFLLEKYNRTIINYSFRNSGWGARILLWQVEMRDILRCINYIFLHEHTKLISDYIFHFKAEASPRFQTQFLSVIYLKPLKRFRGYPETFYINIFKHSPVYTWIRTRLCIFISNLYDGIKNGNNWVVLSTRSILYTRLP